MKAQIILNCILVATLMANHAAFAGTYAEHQDHHARPAISTLTTHSAEAAALIVNVLNTLNNDNHTEMLQRISVNARRELSQKLDTAALLNEIKNAERSLKIFINKADDLLSLTAR